MRSGRDTAYSLVHDTLHYRLLLFGGDDRPVNELWEYPLPSGPWSIVTPVGEPAFATPLSFRRMDPLRNQMLVVGSYQVSVPNHGVWAYDSNANAWIRLTTTNPQSSPDDGQAVWDPTGHRLLMFEGASSEPSRATRLRGRCCRRLAAHPRIAKLVRQLGTR